MAEINEDNQKEHSELQAEIKAMHESFQSFVDQYEIDMRGDKEIQNGREGIIGWIRNTQKYLNDYPSITYLLKTQPLPTASVILACYVLLEEASKAGGGLMELIKRYFGL